MCFHCGKVPYRPSRRPPEATCPLTDPPSPPGRYRYGGKIRRHDWPRILPLLGKHPDRHLARLIGADEDTVAIERKILGIPRYRWWRGFEHLFGKLPDPELARRAGVHPKTVQRVRAERGIPPLPRSQISAAHKLRDYLNEMDRLFNV